MAAMTDAARQEFLAGLHVGVLAVERPDGPPLNVPIWYAYEPGGDVELITSRTSVKARLLERAGRASLCAQQEELPYKYVSVEGAVSIEPLDDARTAIEPIAIRYLGEQLGADYAAGSTGDDQVLVRLRIERWLTVDYGS
jgi:PPOX class probable F420-dependent enzyme